MVRSVLLVILLFVALLTGSGSTLANSGLLGKPAPQINNDAWIHTEPLRLKDLRGKVVLLEFWTYG